MEHKFTHEYPYGQFPFKNTKIGQKQYFEEIQSQNRNVTVEAIEPPPQQESPQENNIDISKLLPLIKMMSNKKSISSTDMLRLFLPLLGGNSNGISEILSLMSESKSTNEYIEEDIPPNNLIRIDEYKRVE